MLRLLAMGLNSRQIAMTRSLRPRTLQRHAASAWAFDVAMLGRRTAREVVQALGGTIS